MDIYDKGVIIITSKMKNIMSIFLIFIIFFLFFANVKDINLTIYNSLIFCGNTLICSIFPFMVISSFISNTYIIEKLLSKSKNNILGICKIYLPSIILGSIAGFVTGAKCIREIYSKNPTDSESFSNAIILSSNAGIGFIVACVGVRIWNSTIYGFILYAFQIIISLFLGKIFFRKKQDENYFIITQKANYINAFTDAISSSAQVIITMCSFIIFFSIIITTISTLFPIETRTEVSSILNIFLEFCTGAFKCVSFKNTLLCGFLTGFSIGFGGLCVHFQIFSVCNNFPLSKGKFFVFKLIHGLLLGAISSIIVFSLKLEPNNSSIAIINELINIKGLLFITGFILIVYLIKKFQIFNK